MTVTDRLSRVHTVILGAYAAVARFFDWCWWELMTRPPMRWAWAGIDRLCAPLYRREARRAIQQIEQDIAMIAPLDRPVAEAQLRAARDAWVRRLSRLGGK